MDSFVARAGRALNSPKSRDPLVAREGPENMACPAGFEPATYGLEGRCSIRAELRAAKTIIRETRATLSGAPKGRSSRPARSEDLYWPCVQARNRAASGRFRCGGGVRELRIRGHGDGNGANESACLWRLSHADARVVDAAAFAVSHSRSAEDIAVTDTGIVDPRSLVLSP